MSIDLKKLALPFHENEIEWRIGQCGKKGNGQIWATCMAYVQARAIMNRLDDVCGAQNWRVSYSFIPSSQGTTAGVISQLSIYVDGIWVTKEDGAEQTNIESFKGGISSALKRAGSVWGIGRYLYGLEQGFAQIDDGGSQWGKTKDGTEFYWNPPRLPAWALPEGDPVGSNGIHPEKPGPNDGFPDVTWKFTFGQWKARTVEQVYKDPKFGGKALASWIDWLESESKRKNEPLTAKAQDAITHVEQFLGAMENAVSP